MKEYLQVRVVVSQGENVSEIDAPRKILRKIYGVNTISAG